MATTCRICMETTEDTLPIATMKSSNEIEILKLGNMYEYCFGIEVTDMPEYLNICMTCKIQLTYYSDFRQLALKTNTELMKLSKSQDAKVEPIPEPSAQDYDDNEVYDANVKNESDQYDCDNSEGNIEYLEEDIQQLDATEFIDEEIPQMELDLYKDQSLDDAIVDDETTINHGEVEYYETNHNDDESDAGTDTEKCDKLDSRKNERWKYHCEFCGKKFRNIDIYNGHLNVHRGLPAYSCELCGREFKHKVNYDYHMKNHNNKRSYVCSVLDCGKTCLSRWDLKIHMRTHLDVRPYSCEVCGRAFRVKSHVTDHMETHTNNKTYECPTCLQKYKTRASLKMHVATIHLKQNQYTCNVCGKIFYRNHHLKVHQKVHERNIKVEQG